MAERLLSRDELVEVVRRKLNEEKVKLWLSPYSEDDGQKGIVPEVRNQLTRQLGNLCIKLMNISKHLPNELLRHGRDELCLSIFEATLFTQKQRKKYMYKIILLVQHQDIGL